MPTDNLYAILLDWEGEILPEEYLEVIGPFIGRENAELAAKDYENEPRLNSVSVVAFGFARSWAGRT